MATGEGAGGGDAPRGYWLHAKSCKTNLVSSLTHNSNGLECIKTALEYKRWFRHNGPQMRYQEALPKVVGTNDVHTDKVMVPKRQVSQLVNEVRRRCLAQDLIHLHAREATALNTVCALTWGPGGLNGWIMTA